MIYLYSLKQTTWTHVQISNTRRSDNVVWIKTKHTLENSDTQNQPTEVEQILNISVVQEYSDVYIIKWSKSPLDSTNALK